MVFLLDSQGEFLYSPSHKKQLLITHNTPFRLDQDIFTFRGVAGETVKVRVEVDPSSAGLGKRVVLIAKDSIRGVRIVRMDRGALPNEITLTLPAAGKYLIIVAERPKFAKGKRYHGAYCLTLEALPDTAQSLTPTRWVE